MMFSRFIHEEPKTPFPMCPTKSKASRSQATFHANMNLNKHDHFLKEKLNQGKGPDLTSSVKKNRFTKCTEKKCSNFTADVTGLHRKGTNPS